MVPELQTRENWRLCNALLKAIPASTRTLVGVLHNASLSRRKDSRSRMTSINCTAPNLRCPGIVWDVAVISSHPRFAFLVTDQ